jgi:hypothetical protein
VRKEATAGAIGEFERAIAGGVFVNGSHVAVAALLTTASTLAASIAATVIGGGLTAVIGSLLAMRVSRHHKYQGEQVRHGGLLLWVRSRDEERQRIAQEIMRAHSGHDVHVHDWST